MRVAILFGSTARDRTTDASDVDVAVLAPRVDLLALAGDLSRALGHDVDIVDLRTDSIPLLSAIVRDGVPVHEGVRGAEAAWRSATLMALETDGPAYRRMSDAWLAALAAGRGRG